MRLPFFPWKWLDGNSMGLILDARGLSLGSIAYSKAVAAAKDQAIDSTSSSMRRTTV